MSLADALATSGRSVPALSCANDGVSAAITSEHVEKLATRGHVVVDDLLQPLTWRALRFELEMLMMNADLHPPGQPDHVRSDVVCWLHGDDLELDRELTGGTADTYLAVTKRVVRQLRGVAHAVQRHVSQPLTAGESGSWGRDLQVPLSAMVACYDGAGTRYVQHVDNDGVTGDRRELSAVLYVNDANWDCEKDGGALRCHDVVGGYTDTYTDIAPVGGRLVLFKSRKVLHEVMPSQRRRFAITIWFEGPDEEWTGGALGPRRLGQNTDSESQKPNHTKNKMRARTGCGTPLFYWERYFPGLGTRF